MDIHFDDFGVADIARVRDKHIDWGTYYLNMPHVIVIDLSKEATKLADVEWSGPS